MGGKPKGRPVGTASWKGLKRLLVFYVLFFGCSLAHGLTEHVESGPGLDAVFIVLWAVLAVIFLKSEWDHVSQAFQFHWPKPKVLGQVLLACLATFLFLKLYFGLFHYFGWPSVNMSRAFVKAGWPWGAIFAALCLEPGIFEEIAFRGVFQTQLARILSQKEALLLQAAMFSILHLSPAIFVSHFVLGLLLGWVRQRTGHVYFGMVLHMAWNGLVVLQEMAKG